MSRTVRPLLGGVLTAVVVLSGCAAQVGGVAVGVDAGGEQTMAPTTGGGTDGDVQQFVALIADGMSGVTSYEGKISTDLGGTAGAGGSLVGTLRGTVKDGKAENSEATMGIGVGAQSIEVTVLMVRTKTYLGGESLLQVVPGAQGKTWVHADPNSSTPVIKRLAASMSAAGGNNSSIESFTTFAQAAKSVEKGGTSTVNGEDVTAYMVELDPAKLGSSAPAASSAMAMFYLDGDNRMRRVEVDVTASGVKVVVTLDMTDYNTPVDISAPDPSDVYSG
ncbi:MAG: hypothetical protein WKF57_10370 [Nakamurella sp.]